MIGARSDKIGEVEIRELLSCITAMILTGCLILGNRLIEVEYAFPLRLRWGLR